MSDMAAHDGLQVLGQSHHLCPSAIVNSAGQMTLVTHWLIGELDPELGEVHLSLAARWGLEPPVAEGH